jgi:hypothetical protein
MNQENIINKLQEVGYFYRGQLINDLIYLERLIDEAVSRHFCTDLERKKELMELMLSNERIGFYNKVQIFEYIFKTHKPEFVKANPNIFSDLKKLIDERNIVAHYLLDTSETGKEEYINKGNIGFVKFRNSTETLWRTQEMYLNFHQLTSNYIKSLSTYLTT